MTKISTIRVTITTVEVMNITKPCKRTMSLIMALSKSKKKNTSAIMKQKQPKRKEEYLGK
jgi:hypothetical protein